MTAWDFVIVAVVLTVAAGYGFVTTVEKISQQMAESLESLEFEIEKAGATLERIESELVAINQNTQGAVLFTSLSGGPDSAEPPPVRAHDG